MAVKKDQEFKVKIAVDIDKTTEQSLKSAGLNLNNLGKDIKNAQTAVKTFGSSLAKVGLVVTTFNQTLDLTRKAYAMLTGPLTSSIKSFIAQEKAESKLVNTLRLTGQYTAQVRNEFIQFANTLQDTTVLSDETTIEMLAQAKALGLNNNMAKLLVKTSADLASVTRVDVNTAYEQLLKTFSGSTGRLAMIIPELKGLSAEQLKAGDGVKLLAQRFGGFAEIEAKTLQGSLKQLANMFDELKEEIGKTVINIINLPKIITFIRSILIKFIDVLKNVRISLESFIKILSEINLSNLINGITSLTIVLSGFFIAINLSKLSSLTAALYSLAKAFVAVSISGIKFTLIAAAIVGAASAVDILLANMKDLSALSETIAGSFNSIFLRIKRGFNGLVLIIYSGIHNIIEYMASLGLISNASLQQSVQRLQSFSNAIDDVNQELVQTHLALSDVAKNVKLGFTGDVINVFKKLLSSSDKELIDIKDHLTNIGSTQRTINFVTEQQIQTLKSIQDENASIELQILNIGKSNVEQLKNQLAYDLQRLEIRRQQLKLEDRYNKQIEAELSRQIELLKQLSQKQEVEIIISETAEPAQFVARAAHSIFKTFQDATGLLSDSFISSAVIVSAKIADGLFKAGSFVINAIVKLFDPSFWEGIVNSIGDSLAKLPEALVNILTKLSDILAQFIESFPKAFATMVDRMPEIFDRLGKLLPNLAKVLMDALVKLFENLPDILQPLINAIPLVFEEILKKLPALVKTIFLAIGDIFAMLVKNIPDVVVSIMEHLPDIVEAIIVGISSMMDRVVMAFVNFFIGGGLEKIVVALIRLIPRIVIAIARGLLTAIKNSISYVFGKRLKMPKEISEFPDKITDAAKNFATTGMQEASKLFAVKDFIDPLKKVELPTFDEMITSLEEASIVFGKNILGEFLKNAWQKIYLLGKAMWDGFWGMVSSMWEFVKLIGKRIWEGFDNAIKTMWNTVVNIGNGIASGIVDVIFVHIPNIVSGFKDAFVSMFATLSGVFKKAGESVWEGFKDLFTKGFDGLVDGLISKIKVGNLLERMFPQPSLSQGTVESLIAKIPGFKGFDLPYVKFAEGGLVPGRATIPGDSPLNDKVLALLSPGEVVIPRSLMQNPEIAAKIYELLKSGNIPGFALGGKIKKGFQKIGDIISKPVESAQEIFKSITNPIEMFVDKIQENLGRMFEGAIAQGLGGMYGDGLVYAQAGGFVARGTDRIPAMLSPGEFVVNAKAARANLGLLTSINEGYNTGSSGTINIEKIEINAQTQLSPESIRREVLPAIVNGLKRKSQDGEFVLSSRGIR